MEKEYREIEFMCGEPLSQCISDLINYAKKGELVYGDFNGHRFYSDTVTLDSAYLEIHGITYNEYKEKQNKRMKEIEKEEQEYKNSIHSLIIDWINKGHKILKEDKWEMWDKCVPIRLNDLYKGMELKCCLDIVSIIRNKSFDDALEEMNNQGHSGCSWGLVKSMVREFSEQGKEFIDYLTEKGL